MTKVVTDSGLGRNICGKKQCQILQPTFILKNNEIRLSSKKTRRKDLFARIINTRKRENLCAPYLQVNPSTNLSFRR